MYTNKQHPDPNGKNEIKTNQFHFAPKNRKEFIGAHRSIGAKTPQFVDPTPAEGQIIPAVYIPILGRLGASFRIKAYMFKKTIRYKQYISGYYKYDKTFQSHKLKSGELHLTDFQEDRTEHQSYGDLNRKEKGLSFYNDEIQFGKLCPTFYGEDSPCDFLDCPSGTRVEINLAFKGVICDADPPYFTYVTRHWYVRGTCIKL